MLEAESSSESPYLATVTRSGVTNDLNLPVILLIANSQVTVAGNFLVTSSNRGSNVVRVQVATGLSMDESDNRVITNKSEIALGVVVLLSAVGVEEPVVVGILVVVAGNLLLLGALGVSLDVRVKKTTTVSHVLDSRAGTKSNLQGAVLSNLSALEVGLEKRAHLGITGTSTVKNGKVQGERE
jgi:hypothetical protein